MPGGDDAGRSGTSTTLTELDTETLPPFGAAARGADPLVPALTVLCHPDPRRIGEQARLTALLDGREVVISRAEPGFSSRGGSRHGGRPLGDPHISRTPIRLRPAGEGVEVVGNLAQQGVRIDGEPADQTAVIGVEALDRGVVIEIGGRVTLLIHRLGMPRQPGPTLGLVGESEAIEAVRAEVLRIARSDGPVLLRGESGTGKELVARAIHEQSSRSSRVFLSVNMAAVPSTTAVSELFGHIRGAFTGATHDAEGYFGRANGGTLFLDEIGDTPFEVQAMLLRALESGEIQPVGAHQIKCVDVRLIAATETDLENAVETGRFRTALYHRLAGFEVTMPPLRERRDDIARLLIHFLHEELDRLGRAHRLEPPLDRSSQPWLPAAVVAHLVRHSWPGNVRQLRNAARRLAVASAELPSLELDPAIEKLLGDETATAADHTGSDADTATADRGTARVPVEAITDELLAATLRECGFQPGAAAARLGIGRTTLYKLIDRSPTIRKAADLTDDELRDAWRECDGDIAAMTRRLAVSERALKLRLRKLDLER
jgi:two-component system nitrogen regulation response regulator GlnG